VIEKYGDYAEMLSGTSKEATDRFKAALGDVTEMFGKAAPLDRTSSKWMEDYSIRTRRTDHTRSIEGELRRHGITWEPWEDSIGLAGSFLALKTA
jgi:hypothetical protein